MAIDLYQGSIYPESNIQPKNHNRDSYGELVAIVGVDFTFNNNRRFDNYKLPYSGKLINYILFADCQISLNRTSRCAFLLPVINIITWQLANKDPNN